jgi:CRISPR-associated exonuclease Cas4
MPVAGAADAPSVVTKSREIPCCVSSANLVSLDLAKRVSVLALVKDKVRYRARSCGPRVATLIDVGFLWLWMGRRSDLDHGRQSNADGLEHGAGTAETGGTKAKSPSGLIDFGLNDLPPQPRHRRQVSRRPQSGIHHLGRGHRRGNGCVITPVDGRHSTRRARRSSSADKLTVPVDETLVSHRYGPVGRPDYVIDAGGAPSPVEVKSRSAGARGPYPGEKAQLYAYCLLVEEMTGKPVTSGVIQFADRQWTVPFGAAERREILGILGEMRALQGAANVRRSHSHAGKCRGCGFNAAGVCGRALA